MAIPKKDGNAREEMVDVARVLLQTRYWTYDVKHAYYAILFVDMLRDVVILDQHESEAMGLKILQTCWLRFFSI